MSPSYAVIVPIYNEGTLITETARQILEKVKGNFQIYFIYDMDEDTSLPFLKQLNNPKISLIKNKYGKGALNAIKTGFEASKDEYCIVFMADLSEDPLYMNDMIKKSKEGYDMVCGSRYMKGGSQIGGPKLKAFLSRMAGISLYYLTGIPTHDISNSFKLVSRKALRSINIESTGGFEIGIELTVKSYLKGFKITEIPVTWKDREEGKSNFKLMKWLPKYLYWYLYFLKNHFSKHY